MEYKKTIVYLGGSDIASLTLRGCNQNENYHISHVLRFGGDGSYHGYFVSDENVEIPEHYKLDFECENWLWIYDDQVKVLSVEAKSIKVYRAGDYGVIIQAVGGNYNDI